MDYTLFEEELVDYLCRMHHEYAVARSRAQAIIKIAKGCDEELVGAALACDEVIPLAPYADPFSTWPEGALAVETITRFNQEKWEERRKLTIDLNDDEHAGGSWLRRHRVRCPRCGRIYMTISSVFAQCPRCGEPGPWVLDCRGPLPQ
jgi:hypothetical protein